jgi:hypothetical protein
MRTNALAYVVVLVLVLAGGVGLGAATITGREQLFPGLLWSLFGVALALPVLIPKGPWRVAGYIVCVVESVVGLLLHGFSAFAEWFYIEAHKLGAGPRPPDNLYMYGNLASALLFLLALVCTTALVFVDRGLERRKVADSAGE